MRTRYPVHDVGAREGHTQRHSGSNSLGDTNDVGLDAGMLDGPPFTGSANAGLDFISNQQDAILVANAPQFTQEFRGRGKISALTLHRLDKNRSYLFRRQRGFEKFLLDETRGLDGVLFGIRPLGTAVEVGIGY